MKKINIAIDGYSSCGKSTMAKSLAKKLHYVYIDSGAMYRAVTLYAIRKGFIFNSNLISTDLIKALPNIHIHFERRNGQMFTYLNDENVEEEIRTMEVSRQVSNVSTIREVRELLHLLQQKMSSRKGVVMDGRDIGTVVLPHAELKIFMLADIAVRTQRRFEELRAKGHDLSLEEVAENLSERDYKDTNRTENPLIQADDARILDNTNLNPEEQLALAEEWVEESVNALM